jgi:GAF domain-containing protein
MKPRTSEAKSALAALDAELAANGQARGVELYWSPRELDLLESLGASIDRRVELAALYAKALKAGDDDRLVIQLSAEMRQLDKQVSATYKDIETDAPQQQESLTTQKNRMAANTRWQRVREQEGRARG